MKARVVRVEFEVSNLAKYYQTVVQEKVRGNAVNGFEWYWQWNKISCILNFALSFMIWSFQKFFNEQTSLFSNISPEYLTLAFLFRRLTALFPSKEVLSNTCSIICSSFDSLFIYLPKVVLSTVFLFARLLYWQVRHLKSLIWVQH